MIRIIIALIFVVCAIVISLPVWLIFEVVGLFSENAKEMASLAFLRLAFKIIVLIAGTKVHFIGEENIPADTPVLYVGNHRSFFDIIIQGTRFTRPTAFIAKKEFLKVPVFGLWMKNIHCLALDRDNLRQGLKVILKAIDYIGEGRSVFVYPEGTRNRSNELLLPFKEGSMKIATKSGCPIIPVAITNSSAVFEDQFPRLKKATVIVHYGKPIYPSALTAEDFKFPGRYTAGVISEMLLKDKKQL